MADPMTSTKLSGITIRGTAFFPLRSISAELVSLVKPDLSSDVSTVDFYVFGLFFSRTRLTERKSLGCMMEMRKGWDKQPCC